MSAQWPHQFSRGYFCMAICHGTSFLIVQAVGTRVNGLDCMLSGAVLSKSLVSHSSCSWLRQLWTPLHNLQSIQSTGFWLSRVSVQWHKVSKRTQCRAKDDAKQSSSGGYCQSTLAKSCAVLCTLLRPTGNDSLAPVSNCIGRTR